MNTKIPEIKISIPEGYEIDLKISKNCLLIGFTPTEQLKASADENQSEVVNWATSDVPDEKVTNASVVPTEPIVSPQTNTLEPTKVS